jgi:hypothetical protein
MTIHITEKPDAATVSEMWPTLKDFTPRCRDCRHWDAEGVDPTDGIGVGICQGMTQTIAVYVRPGVEIATRAYFGCFLWEPKP